MKKKVEVKRFELKNGQEFAVHFWFDSLLLYFQVYPVDTDEKGQIWYNSNSDRSLQVFDDQSSQMDFCGSVRWRGVWDNRLYFPDEEYWGTQLAEMSELYNEHILPQGKKLVCEVDEHAEIDAY